jgi:hypothetical protein
MRANVADDIAALIAESFGQMAIPQAEVIKKAA